jgi:hypothetical protein
VRQLLLSGGTFLILTDTMGSQDFLDWRPLSEFVGSSRFLYPIKTTETLLKIQERTGRSGKSRFYLTEILYQLIFWHICSHYHFFSVLSHDGVYTELGYFRFILKGFSLNVWYCFSAFFTVSALIADRIGRKNAYYATTAIFFWFCLFFFLEFVWCPVLVTLFFYVSLYLLLYGPFELSLSEAV